jgi:hypothetical protein
MLIFTIKTVIIVRMDICGILAKKFVKDVVIYHALPAAVL